jgi:hypothetical protein
MAEKQKEKREGIADLKPSDAEAPGPITPEHESGSWEQTLAEQEARDKLDEVRTGKSSTGESETAAPATTSKTQKSSS